MCVAPRRHWVCVAWSLHAVDLSVCQLVMNRQDSLSVCVYVSALFVVMVMSCDLALLSFCPLFSLHLCPFAALSASCQPSRLFFSTLLSDTQVYSPVS